MNSPQSISEQAYQSLIIEDEGRLCKDIPESACNQQPRHFLTHALSLISSKVADGLVDPKLILSWLMAQLGASSVMIALLVPIRESGALLPQLFSANWIRNRAQRKWVWASGSFLQGVSVIAMAVSVLLLAPKIASYLVLCFLGGLAIARSFCSVSYKDVLGKTISQSTRGTLTGLASSVASVAIIALSIFIGFGLIKLSLYLVLLLLLIAGTLWIFAAFNFLNLKEKSGSTEGGQSAVNGLSYRIKSAFNDADFITFVAVRALLIGTAIAPPFMVVMMDESRLSSSGVNNDLISLNNVSQLGLMLFASALASFVSSYVWGRLADQSSRRVLMFAALLSFFSLAFLFIVSIIFPTLLNEIYTIPLSLFFLMIAYNGVRLGRSTHLVDMADSNTRANYTAVSNSVIGVLLMVSAVFGLVAENFGANLVIGIFAMLSLSAAIISFKLKELQN